MLVRLDATYLSETVGKILQRLRADSGHALDDVIVRLEVLHRTLRTLESTPHCSADHATEVEFHSLLSGHPKLQKIYLLRHTEEARRSALAALQRFATLAETRQLSDDETCRLRKIEESLRKWEEFEDEIKRRYEAAGGTP
jgi:hypothetical protein